MIIRTEDNVLAHRLAYLAGVWLLLFGLLRVCFGRHDTSGL